MSKKQILVLAFVGLLILANTIMFLSAWFLFPEHWGFDRYVIFIHPDDSKNKGGYFLVIDELTPRTQLFDIDWVLHGRGEMDFGEHLDSVKYSTQSYLSNDIISLNISFLSPVQQLTTHDGRFYPVHDPKSEDTNTTYLKARYAGSSNPIFGTILYPKNETDLSKTMPKISRVGVNTIGQIGDTDLVYYESSSILDLLSNPNVFSSPNDVVTDAKIFFIRKNASDLIEYYFVQDVTQLTFENIAYLRTSIPVDNVLINYADYQNEITGIINIELYKGLIETELIEENLLPPEWIQIYVPFTAKNLTVDGVDTPFTQSGKILTFELDGSHSFHISRAQIAIPAVHGEINPLRNASQGGEFPAKAKWEFDIDTISELKYPYLLFDDSELEDLDEKIANPAKPWKVWYDSVISNVHTYATTAISTWDEDARVWPIRVLALFYAIEGKDRIDSEKYLNKIKEILLNMSSVENSYTQDLRRSYALQAYSIAYDIIREDITPEERVDILNLLDDHAFPLSQIDLYSDNNHRVVDAGGLGLAGLVLQNKNYIDIATETILHYLYEKVKDEGASYEGQSYLGFAWRESMEFMTALKRLGGYNFFNDTRYVNSLEFMAESFSPLATPPLFEDATTNPRCNDVLLMAASQMDDVDKAKEFQWLWELRANNEDLAGQKDYDYLLGAGASDRRIYCYKGDDKIPAVKPDYSSQVYRNSNMAILRSGYEKDSIYLSLTCKNYTQSHPHYDENSFELWAYGAWLAINPGYPGWGEEGHDWAIQTEASNTLLVNNEGQLYPHAQGFISSITSPYFDMVRADAIRAYNSPGSMAESLQPYVMIFIMFIFLSVSFYLIYAAKRDTRRMIERKEEQQDSLEVQNISIQKDRRMKIENYSKANFFYDIFMYPKTAQKRVFLRSQEKNVKLFNYIFSGLLVGLILLNLLYIQSKINYHIQYYEAHYGFFAQFLPLIEIILIVIILLIVFAAYYAFIRIFGRICNYICGDCDPKFPYYRKQIENAFSVSLTWQLFLVAIGYAFMWFTVMWGVANLIHDIFTKVGGMSEVIMLLFALMGQGLVVIYFLTIFEILFFLNAVQSMGYTISIMSEARIRSRDGTKIAIASLFIVFCIMVMIVLAIFFALTSLVSTIGVELLTGGG